MPEPACDALTVGGVTYRHSAAKFWPRLIDEALALHPACTRIELAALTPEAFDPVRLDPHAELQRDARDLAEALMEDVIRETVAQLALYGPPPLVRVRLLEGDRELYAAELPGDCADAEVFVFLVGWLLEWASVPRDTWINLQLRGAFAARDQRRKRTYGLQFATRREHVREGLYRVVVALDPKVSGQSAQ